MWESLLSELDRAVVTRIVQGPGIFQPTIILRHEFGATSLDEMTGRGIIATWDEFTKTTYGIRHDERLTLTPWSARLVRVQIAERLILVPGLASDGSPIEVVEERPYWAMWPKEKDHHGEWIDYRDEDDPYIDLGLILPQIKAVELPQRRGEFSQPYLDHLPDPRTLPDRSGLRPLTRAQRRALMRQKGANRRAG